MASATNANAGQNPSRAAANSPSAPMTDRFHGCAAGGRYENATASRPAVSAPTAARVSVMGLSRGSVGGVWSTLTAGLQVRRAEFSDQSRPGAIRPQVG
jgi:hypothetical protein